MESFRDAIAPVDEEASTALPATLSFAREFDEFMHSPSDERKAALVRRLSALGGVPQEAKAPLARMLLAKLEESTLRHEMAEGKSMARHTLNALLSLGYPWALEVPADTLRQLEEAERRSTSLFTVRNTVLGLALFALVLVHVFYGVALLANSHYAYTQFLADLWKDVTSLVR